MTGKFLTIFWFNYKSFLFFRSCFVYKFWLERIIESIEPLGQNFSTQGNMKKKEIWPLSLSSRYHHSFLHHHLPFLHSYFSYPFMRQQKSEQLRVALHLSFIQFNLIFASFSTHTHTIDNLAKFFLSFTQFTGLWESSHHVTCSFYSTNISLLFLPHFFFLSPHVCYLMLHLGRKMNEIIYCIDHRSNIVLTVMIKMVVYTQCATCLASRCRRFCSGLGWTENMMWKKISIIISGGKYLNRTKRHTNGELIHI